MSQNLENQSAGGTSEGESSYPLLVTKVKSHIGGQFEKCLQQIAASQVQKRDGRQVAFDLDLIAVAILKAFESIYGEQVQQSPSILKRVAQVLLGTVEALCKLSEQEVINIEIIQNHVEAALITADERQVAVAYMQYRDLQAQQRDDDESSITVVTPQGETKVSQKSLQEMIVSFTQGLSAVDHQYLAKITYRNLFDGIAEEEFFKAMILVTKSCIENEPNYSKVASRMLLWQLKKEAAEVLGVKVTDGLHQEHIILKDEYQRFFKAYINHGIAHELLDPKLGDFDLEAIGAFIDCDRDDQISYLSMQTLYDRYFLHTQDRRFELPQIFFMRVAMGLAINEPAEQQAAHVKSFYDEISRMNCMSSTPTLFNSGTQRPQLSSCYLTTIEDSLHGIFNAFQENAQLSKFAGGLGNDWTNIRGMGAYIKGTNGKSLGVIPFMNIADATAVAVNQGGKRKGAVCAYLETWHMDIEDFLELRKNTGDDRRRTHDMNTANWVPDLFMKRVHENKMWTLFSPDEVSDLHDLYGLAFEAAYERYEQQAAEGKIRSRQVKAVNLWRKMLGMVFETGHPWITFKDPCNIRSPQQHVGCIHSSNLCTEITLNTRSGDDAEIAVCNLASINLAEHVNEHGLDEKKIAHTVKIMMRMLDNVIDVNFYPVEAARRSNLRHRPVGLGVMGFQDALYKLGISYACDDAVEFADRSMEMISYYAILSSTELAQERGAYESYQGSLWDQGILPIDSIELLRKARGQYLDQDTSSTMDWTVVREAIKKHGMRNSNVLAIAPTATISNLCEVAQSIEPTYQNLYVKSNLSGEFTIVNPYLVKDLKALNLWDELMVKDLKYFDGSVQNIDRIPAKLRQVYATSFEVDVQWLIKAASRRAKWIDQAQSLNLYLAQPSGKALDAMYRLAWTSGLKTTYYLRSLGASAVEKSTIKDGAYKNSRLPKGDPNGGECEVCQ